MENVSEFYRKYNTIRPHFGKSSNKSYFDDNLGRVLQTLRLEKSARILEIGPGTGEVLTRLREDGYVNLEAFEICDSYRHHLKAKGFYVHSAENLKALVNQLEDESYDVMIAMDVFEHIEKNELYDFLKAFKRKLKTKGVIVGQVPNSSGLFGHNTFLADITHVTPFNELGLNSMLMACGYNQIKISQTRLPRTFLNLPRIAARMVIFRLTYLFIRLIGATPIKHFSHLIFFQASYHH